jgi:hypothetical protein
MVPLPVVFRCECGREAVARETTDDCGGRSGRVECTSCGRWGFWHDHDGNCNLPFWWGNDRDIVLCARFALKQGPACPWYLGMGDLGVGWAQDRSTGWLREVVARWQKYRMEMQKGGANMYTLYGDGIVWPGEPVIKFTHQATGVVAIVNHSGYGWLVACDLAKNGWVREVTIWDPNMIPDGANIVAYGTALWSMMTSRGRQYWLSDVKTAEYEYCGLPVLSTWEYYETNGKFPTKDSINDVALYAF